MWLPTCSYRRQSRFPAPEWGLIGKPGCRLIRTKLVKIITIIDSWIVAQLRFSGMIFAMIKRYEWPAKVSDRPLVSPTYKILMNSVRSMWRRHFAFSFSHQALCFLIMSSCQKWFHHVKNDASLWPEKTVKSDVRNLSGLQSLSDTIKIPYTRGFLFCTIVTEKFIRYIWYNWVQLFYMLPVILCSKSVFEYFRDISYENNHAFVRRTLWFSFKIRENLYLTDLDLTNPLFNEWFENSRILYSQCNSVIFYGIIYAIQLQKTSFVE